MISAMPPRQVWLFRFGCWAAIATAIVHLAGHISGPEGVLDPTGRQLVDLMTTYRFQLPGGTDRTMMEFMGGFSLVFSVFFATLGALGLTVAGRASDDAALVYATARIAAIASAATLAISLTSFFIVPTLLIAAVTTCFAVSAVKAPGH
jgi:hypothetical protein